jgi:hypothetical protein
MAPFWLWTSGQVLEDRRILTLPPGAPAQDHHIGIGLYDPVTGKRLQVMDEAGNRLPDGVVILPAVTDQ